MRHLEPGPRRAAPRQWVRALAILLLAAPIAGAAATAESAAEAYRLGDYGAAAEQFRELAEGGDARAQAILGLMHVYGEGVVADLRTAFAWYRRAAEAGYPPAQFRIAEMYASGEGVARDPGRARAWLERAARGGSESARRALRMGVGWVPDAAPVARAGAADLDALPAHAPPAEALIAGARRTLRDRARIGAGWLDAMPRLRLSLAPEPRPRPGTAAPSARDLSPRTAAPRLRLTDALGAR